MLVSRMGDRSSTSRFGLSLRAFDVRAASCGHARLPPCCSSPMYSVLIPRLDLQPDPQTSRVSMSGITSSSRYPASPRAKPAVSQPGPAPALVSFSHPRPWSASAFSRSCTARRGAWCRGRSCLRGGTWLLPGIWWGRVPGGRVYWEGKQRCLRELARRWEERKGRAGL
jgi:hypothetical protein